MSIFEVNVFNIHQYSINLPDLAESASSQRSLVLASANSATRDLSETGGDSSAVAWNKYTGNLVEETFSSSFCWPYSAARLVDRLSISHFFRAG
jgi:hypothetical protein